MAEAVDIKDGFDLEATRHEGDLVSKVGSKRNHGVAESMSSYSLSKGTPLAIAVR